jgi:phosphatidylserine decarboxylase
MTNPRAVFLIRSPLLASPSHGGLIPTQLSISPYLCRYQRQSPRHFSSSVRFCRQQDGRESFGTRLRRALGQTRIRWYPIPVGLGIGFLALTQFYKVNEREKIKQREEEEDAYLKSAGKGEEQDSEGRPKRRKRIRPTGPWFVCLTMLHLIQH